MITPEFASGSSLYSKSSTKFSYVPLNQSALSTVDVMPSLPSRCHVPGLKSATCSSGPSPRRLRHPFAEVSGWMHAGCVTQPAMPNTAPNRAPAIIVFFIRLIPFLDP